MACEDETQPQLNAKKLTQRGIDLVATLLGLGVILAAVAVLFEDGPVGSGLMLFIAGLVLMPFIPIPGRGTRTVVFILALGVAIVTPVWKSFVVHRQTQAAYRFALDAAAALTQASVKDGRWPEDLSGKLPEKLDLPGGGLSRDIRVAECYQEACTLIVTLTDEGYDTSIRSRSFALSTSDGGKTWTCHPTGGYHVRPVDLPADCRGSAP